MNPPTVVRTLPIPLTALLLTVTPVQAMIVLGNGDTVNMAALFAPGGDRLVHIDDKIFNFESFTSSQFQMQNFFVRGYVSAAVNQWGLHNVGFDIVGPFNDPTPGDGMSHEMNLQYSVTVDPEAYARDVRLCDTHLVFDGVAGGMGSYARVDETVWDLDRNQYLGNLSAYYHAGIVDRVRPIDIRDFCEIWGNTHGWRAFEVNKDMKFFARDAESFAMAGFVRQEFSQIMAPSPGVAALVGLAGLLTRRRR